MVVEFWLDAREFEKAEETERTALIKRGAELLLGGFGRPPWSEPYSEERAFELVKGLAEKKFTIVAGRLDPPDGPVIAWAIGGPFEYDSVSQDSSSGQRSDAFCIRSVKVHPDFWNPFYGVLLCGVLASSRELEDGTTYFAWGLEADESERVIYEHAGFNASMGDALGSQNGTRSTPVFRKVFRKQRPRILH